MNKEESKNGLAPFSELVLEAIVLVREGNIPLHGNGALNLALVQFLNDKGYIELADGKDERHISLSKSGWEIYSQLREYVSDKLGF